MKKYFFCVVTIKFIFPSVVVIKNEVETTKVKKIYYLFLFLLEKKFNSNLCVRKMGTIQEI
jgi:hypothetical protein